MKISTEINSISKITGMEKAVEYCAKAGFDGWDFSMMEMCRIDPDTKKPKSNDHPLLGTDCYKIAQKLKQIGLDYGIVCNQSHAPFPLNNPYVRPLLKKCIELTAEAGGEICVIHPDNNKSAEENAETYFELLPFAKECGVKIATENMWNWNDDKGISSFAACATGEDFKKHMEAVNDDFFVACVDIGHAEMRGSGNGAAHMIRTLGHYVEALHIHDNDLLNDSHQIPFSMDINFNEVIKALKDINYKGWFTLEADQYLKDYDNHNIFEGVKNLSKSAKTLAEEFDEL